MKEIKSKMYGTTISSMGRPLNVSGNSRRFSIVVLMTASLYDNKFNDKPTWATWIYFLNLDIGLSIVGIVIKL